MPTVLCRGNYDLIDLRLRHNTVSTYKHSLRNGAAPKGFEWANSISYLIVATC